MMYERTYSQNFTIEPNEYREYVDKFLDWYKSAKSGDKYTYYYGKHLYESLASEYVKKIIWDFACDGKVYIFQARDLEHKDKFKFIAVKSNYKLSWLIPKR